MGFGSHLVVPRSGHTGFTRASGVTLAVLASLTSASGVSDVRISVVDLPCFHVLDASVIYPRSSRCVAFPFHLGHSLSLNLHLGSSGQTAHVSVQGGGVISPQAHFAVHEDLANVQSQTSSHHLPARDGGSGQSQGAALTRAFSWTSWFSVALWGSEVAGGAVDTDPGCLPRSGVGAPQVPPLPLLPSGVEFK